MLPNARISAGSTVVPEARSLLTPNSYRPIQLQRTIAASDRTSKEFTALFRGVRESSRAGEPPAQDGMLSAILGRSGARVELLQIPISLTAFPSYPFASTHTRKKTFGRSTPS